jgi:hypothetical protein
MYAIEKHYANKSRIFFCFSPHSDEINIKKAQNRVFFKDMKKNPERRYSNLCK